jgi:phosphopantothenoylcysteine decarboxylase / phosphopantothenate---cysteine ligase
MLTGKKIVLGVTGGIAAYKAAELTREFVKQGAQVKVIMTKNAAEFITPLTLQTLSNQPVFTEMFSLTREHDIAHISLAEYGDLIVVAPATANVIGKIAAGIADDLLTTVVMAARTPVLFAPAMNVHMYGNPIFKENVEKLTARGYRFMEPGYGELACKTEGQGRLPDIGEIVDEALSILTTKDLEGETVLVTAGPTREPFDPVRFITNYSSGKMGYAIAARARHRGSNVILVSGPASLPVPRGVRFVSVSSALEMRDTVMSHLPEATVVVKAAAVADYRPALRSESKIKKKAGPLTLSLERNPDIIAEIGKKKGNRILVGFAMESENLVDYATEKMVKKNMDFIVANDLTEEGAGFCTDTNVINIIARDGKMERLPLMSKTAVADRILDRVKELIDKR